MSWLGIERTTYQLDDPVKCLSGKMELFEYERAAMVAWMCMWNVSDKLV
jgi:hypothetical protein